MSWARRHPVLTLGYGFLGFLLLLSGDAIGVLIGLAILFHAVVLGVNRFRLGRGISRNTRSPQPASASTLTLPPVGNQRRSVKRSEPSALDRASVASLPPLVRAELTNRLELDEEMDFVVPGTNGSAFVATDRRLFIIVNKRWSSGRAQLIDASYPSIHNVSIDVSGRRGVFLVHLAAGKTAAGKATVEIGLEDQVQMERALDKIPEIRRRVAAARMSESEQSTPVDQSALMETTSGPIQQIAPQSNGSGLSSAFRSLSLGDMLEMTPQEFEEFTGEALSAMGYSNVKRVGGSGDLAADLTATDPQGRSAIVQCKRYTPGSKVGSPAVQQFIGMKAVHHQADRGIFVTTADYSQQAIDLAKQHQIVLIDGDDLVKIASLVMARDGSVARHVDQATETCRVCGRINDPGARYCAACGASLQMNPSA